MSQNENILREDSCVPVPGVEFGTATDANGTGYWETMLADVPSLDLPTDRPRPAVLGRNTGLESVTLRADVISGLHRLCAEAGVDLSTLALAVFSVMLHRYTAQEKFATGVITGSQVLPVVVDFSDRPTFYALVQRLDAAISTASSVGSVFVALPKKFGLDNNPTRHPISQVGFSQRN